MSVRSATNIATCLSEVLTIQLALFRDKYVWWINGVTIIQISAEKLLHKARKNRLEKEVVIAQVCVCQKNNLNINLPKVLWWCFELITH